MTEITVLRGDDGRVIGLSGEGHSGDRPEGENLVCASVTTIFEFLSEGTNRLSGDSFAFRQDPESPRWHIEIHPQELSETERESMRWLLTSAIGVVRNIAETYPEHCRLIDESAK